MSAITMTKQAKDELLESLTERWKAAKEQEALATQHRIEIESEIYALAHNELPDKGTTALDSGMKIVTGFSETWDQEILAEARTRWNAAVPFPFSIEFKPITREVNYIRENMPEAYALIRDALTLKNKKPAFSVKE